MGTSALYFITVLIWGTTWLAIKFQVGTVSPELSVAYRFVLAALMLFGHCTLSKRCLRYGLRDHCFMAIQGVLMFSVNYLLFYWAAEYLTTGLLAVIFSTIIFMNIVGCSVFYGASVQPKVTWGALLGMIGIALVFWHEFSTVGLSRELTTGAILGVVATAFSSLGNMMSVRNQRNRLPVVQTNAFGMAYGAAFMLLIAVVSGEGFAFDFSFAYVSSLLYLAVFGSVFAFGCYLTLLGRIGADRAAYANVLFPIVALVLSARFENFQWSNEALLGFVIVLLGNLLVLSDFNLLLAKIRK